MSLKIPCHFTPQQSCDLCLSKGEVVKLRSSPTAQVHVLWDCPTLLNSLLNGPECGQIWGYMAMVSQKTPVFLLSFLCNTVAESSFSVTINIRGRLNAELNNWSFYIFLLS